MTAPGCPRCGDQTLWRVGRRSNGAPYGWCQLCGHTWAIPFRCDDPEGDWIRDQQKGSDDRND